MEILSETIVTINGVTHFEVRLSNGTILKLDRMAEFDIIDGKAIYKNTDIWVDPIR